jgi:hypothetical protein
VGGGGQDVVSQGLDQYWVGRLQAVGKMQARYLWFLVIVSIFFLGLASGTLRPADGNVKVPVLNLELGVGPILAAGPIVLSFLVLVVMGTLTAYRVASERLGLETGDLRGEATDTEPNFLDMAFYCLKSERPVLRNIPTIVALKYPIFLSAVLVLAGYLLWQSMPSITGGVSVLVWLVAALRVGWYWRRRFRDLWPKKF